MAIARARKRKRQKYLTTILAIAFCALIMGIVVLMTIKNTTELEGITEDSVKSQLTSISAGALEMIDIDRLIGYESMADLEADRAHYDETLGKLRTFAKSVGAEYIYVLKMIGSEAYFIYDTDPDMTGPSDIFEPYEGVSDVHRQAFAGKPAAGILNVVDEYGSYNTGAIPIFKDGRVVGVVSTDIEDGFIRRSQEASVTNLIILIIVMVVTLAVFVVIAARLLRKIQQMQDHLEKMAHYDTITGLPNRQYLLEYLEQITRGPDKAPFALLFIDLDNFKAVNDNVGHDAGDELLKSMADYLESGHMLKAKAFRPAPGMLNIAARIGGDEFVQVIPGVETAEQAGEIAQQLLDDFGTKTHSRYIEMFGVSLSIGVALYPYHTDNFHVLIKYADVAMYNAKHAGKNTYRIYEDGMRSKES